MRAQITGLVWGALLLTVGCSFPDIHFSADSTGGAGTGGSTLSTGGSNGGGTTGGAGATGGAGTTTTETGATGGGGTGGAITTTGPGGTAGSGGAPCCDCDGDQHDSEGGVCGGDDCDDTNKLVYPGEPTYHADKVNDVVGFDWDCDGTLTLDPALNKSIKCGSFNLNQSGCMNAGPAYLDSAIPACGDPGNWGKCSWTGGLPPCVNQPIDPSRKMTCK